MDITTLLTPPSFKKGDKLVLNGNEYIYVGDNTFKKIDAVENMELSIVLQHGKEQKQKIE